MRMKDEFYVSACARARPDLQREFCALEPLAIDGIMLEDLSNNACNRRSPELLLSYNYWVQEQQQKRMHQQYSDRMRIEFKLLFYRASICIIFARSKSYKILLWARCLTFRERITRKRETNNNNKSSQQQCTACISVIEWKTSQKQLEFIGYIPHCGCIDSYTWKQIWLKNVHVDEAHGQEAISHSNAHL